jgi:predicted SAM-dependent methyltransferase
MVKRLESIPYWEDKIKHSDRYEYSQDAGAWLAKRHAAAPTAGQGAPLEAPGGALLKVNYGCGAHRVAGWVNVDAYPSADSGYRQADLLEKHPLRDRSVGFGFSEDFLEHLDQAESIFFLSEVYRTLAPGGVLRLSFPGLEGVLAKHYSPPTEARVRKGELEAYSFWDHLHFYSREELVLVARHVGFNRVEFVGYGASEYPELCNMDTRSHQIGLNTYAELTK